MWMRFLASRGPVDWVAKSWCREQNTVGASLVGTVGASKVLVLLAVLLGVSCTSNTLATDVIDHREADNVVDSVAESTTDGGSGIGQDCHELRFASDSARDDRQFEAIEEDRACEPDCTGKYCHESDGCGGVCWDEVECPQGPGYHCVEPDINFYACAMTCEHACEHEAECGLYEVYLTIAFCDCGDCDDGDPCTEDECMIPGDQPYGDTLFGGGMCNHTPITGEDCP
jgi:hypothetical protein